MTWSRPYPLAGEPARFFRRNPDMIATAPATISLEEQGRLISYIHREGRTYDWIPEEADNWGRGLPGDCENHALWRQWQLQELGLPVGALRVCVGHLARLGHHAVLLVLCNDRADIVLDCMRTKPVPFIPSGPFRPLYRIGLHATKELWQHD